MLLLLILLNASHNPPLWKKHYSLTVMLLLSLTSVSVIDCYGSITDVKGNFYLKMINIFKNVWVTFLTVLKGHISPIAHGIQAKHKNVM